MHYSQLAGTMCGGEQAVLSTGHVLMAAGDAEALRENAEIRAAYFGEI